MSWNALSFNDAFLPWAWSEDNIHNSMVDSSEVAVHQNGRLSLRCSVMWTTEDQRVEHKLDDLWWASHMKTTLRHVCRAGTEKAHARQLFVESLGSRRRNNSTTEHGYMVQQECWLARSIGKFILTSKQWWIAKQTITDHQGAKDET